MHYAVAAHLTRGQHRDKVERDTKRSQEREDHSQRHIAKDLSGDAFDKDDGEKHGNGRQRGGEDRRAYLGGSTHRGAYNIVALFPTAKYALEHDDGVVHQHTHAQRQSAQRHNIERDVVDKHRGKSGYDRYGDRQANNERMYNIAQKDKEH